MNNCFDHYGFKFLFSRLFLVHWAKMYHQSKIETMRSCISDIPFLAFQLNKCKQHVQNEYREASMQEKNTHALNAHRLNKFLHVKCIIHLRWCIFTTYKAIWRNETNCIDIAQKRNIVELIRLKWMIVHESSTSCSQKKTPNWPECMYQHREKIRCNATTSIYILMKFLLIH